MNVNKDFEHLTLLIPSIHSCTWNSPSWFDQNNFDPDIQEETNLNRILSINVALGAVEGRKVCNYGNIMRPDDFGKFVRNWILSKSFSSVNLKICILLKDHHSTNSRSQECIWSSRPAPLKARDAKIIEIWCVDFKPCCMLDCVQVSHSMNVDSEHSFPQSLYPFDRPQPFARRVFVTTPVAASSIPLIFAKIDTLLPSKVRINPVILIKVKNRDIWQSMVLAYTIDKLTCKNYCCVSFWLEVLKRLQRISHLLSIDSSISAVFGRLAMKSGKVNTISK